MQVDNSTLHHNTLPSHFITQEDTHSTPLVSTLLPLHGYHQRLGITVPSWPLPDFATHVASLPAELIDMIQAFCSHDDLLSLTSVDKAALATRFCNPPLQKLSFKTVKDTEHFLSYCQASQEKETEELILEQGHKSRKRLKPALSPCPTMRFTSFTREHLQEIKAVTLTLSAQFTAEQYNLLFTYLPGIQHLTLYSNLTLYSRNRGALGLLLKAAQHLPLHYLAIFDDDNFNDFDDIKGNLPDELWQLATLETLTINGSQYIGSISEAIGQLNALKLLMLCNMSSIKSLPASLGQLDKLEILTLEDLYFIAALPEDIGQLNALTSLTLQHMPELKALPVSIGQLSKLEALNLSYLPSLKTLPEEISQLSSLKSLTLNRTSSLRALPASLGQLGKLEVLTLRKLNNITVLPEEIGQLNALKSLTLKNMDLLKALPASLGQLNKLEALTLENLRSIAALPEEIGQLKALKIVKLVNMREFRRLPTKLAQIVVKEK
jgi:leucine-rich repeat protein SHOC2